MYTENTNMELFFDIINNEKIYTVFQPIVSLRDASILGYEALSRGPKDTEMQNPQVLFECADKYGRLWELEFLCRSKALETIYNTHAQINLFLNVDPNIMNDIKFKKGFTKEYLSKFNINTENIIFEITERDAIKNISAFKKTIQNYKEQNYKIAIDDAGAGYSGLNLISDIHPNYIKLDMNLIRDIDNDNTKKSLVKSMYEFAKLTNTYLIAEGIETKKELLTLIEIGVHYGQGYYLQKPSPTINTIDNQISMIINESNRKKNHMFGKISNIYISNICISSGTLNPNILISQVHKMLNDDFSIPGYCITKNNEVIGVITRNYLNTKLSGNYGYSLNSNKPISKIMNKEFLCVDYQTPIDIVAKKAMQRNPDKLYDFITVTKDNKYYGIVTVKDLLEKTIQIEVVHATHLNPLSQLPGNLLIENHLERCIASPNTYYVLYFDINNFKPYNDVYGFEKGDVVIKDLAEIIKNTIHHDEFIGHIGGDDFIAVVSQNNNIEDLCNKIIEEFEKQTLNYYKQSDYDRKYIISKNRHGVEESFPLISLSIAGITTNCFQNIYQLSEKASAIKKMCKQNTGSAFILNYYNSKFANDIIS